MLASTTELPMGAFLLIVLFGGVLVAVGVYFGLQSLRQARLLQDVVPPGRLAGRVGTAAALVGRPELLDPHADVIKRSRLWERTVWEEYHRGYSSRSSSRTGSWRTVGKEVYAPDFVLHLAPGSR